MVFMVPFNICAGGGQATRQPKQCSTVWEPPTHPTATGVWSESKGRCCCPRCRHKLCLQTDVSTAREGKDGNNPSQATHCLNIMNLKPPATSRAVSSSSSHCSTPMMMLPVLVLSLPFSLQISSHRQPPANQTLPVSRPEK